MTQEEFINKWGKTYYDDQKLGSFYNDVHTLVKSQLKERGKLLLDFAKQLEKDKRLKTKFELEYIVNQFLTKN